MQMPFVAHTSLEYFRWALRSVPRRDGRRFAETLRAPVDVPVLRMHGGLDPYVLPETAATSRSRVSGPLREEVFPSAGHFLPEEAPTAVNAVLVDWLTRLHGGRARPTS
jgi:pimeloyl-ACP methyl ester carboxylesterase